MIAISFLLSATAVLGNQAQSGGLQAPGRCQQNTQPCQGYTQDQGNAQCCSGYCHLLNFNKHTGHMTGLCEEECFLDKQGCFGYSQIEADAQCCSGHCHVLSVDSFGGHHGKCQQKTEQASVDAPIVAPGPVANLLWAEHRCQRNTQPCSGFSQDQGNAQCCSGYCHLMNVDESTGFMQGLCEEQCYLVNEPCFGNSQYEADAQCCSGSCDVLSIDSDGGHHGMCQRNAPAPESNPVTAPATAPVTNPIGAEHHCQRNTQPCSGFSQDQGNDQCCSGYCHLMNVDESTGFMTGLCEEQCFLNDQSCFGNSQYEADAQCCSGHCDVLSIDSDGGHHGQCKRKTSETRRLSFDESAPTPESNPITAPLRGEHHCQRNTQPCSGFSQDQGNAKCCSGYCHLMRVDESTGFMQGLCEEQCFLNDQGCFGYSTYEADAQCCSGHCDVLSIDSDGGHFGKCQRKPTPAPAPCQTLGAACSGTTFKEADDQCCSGDCDNLVLRNGVYHGTCILEGEATAPVTAPLSNPVVAPVQGRCKRENKFCSGYSQDQGNAKCCSGYCHLMKVNEHTGFMTGLCKQQCYLAGQSCSGNSQYEANADCCSGSCDVLSIDADGGHHGVCRRAPVPSPTRSTCQALGESCEGDSFAAADSQCCSGNCNNLTVFGDVLVGTCDLAKEE